MKTTATEYQRLRFTLDAVTDLSLHAVEAREFGSAARSMLYLLTGAVAISRGMMFGCDVAGRLYLLAAKGRHLSLEPEVQTIARMTRSETAALASVPELLDAKDRRIPARLRTALSEGGMRQAIPLVVRGRLAGLLALGPRVNGNSLTEHERGVLETLARYAGVLLHQHDLMQQLRSTVDENLRLCETLADTYFETVQAFSTAIDAKDLYTRGHSVRVARYASLLAARAGLPRKSVAGIRVGAYLHDLGKLVLERALLNKPGDFNDDERREMASHPVVGDEVLSSVNFPWPEVRTVVRHHHERLDGKGYPDRRAGDEIPISARVLCIADAFDAMTTNRPYRERMNVDDALGELVHCSAVQFDPALVHVFLEQCRNEVVAFSENGKKSKKPRGLLGALLDRSRGADPSVIDKLLRHLGSTPKIQTA